MRTVVQRVTHASVKVDGQTIGEIGKGFLILLGVAEEDDEAIADKMADKICRLRIFEDENGKTNLSLADVSGEILVVSQFTLYAQTKKGNRPSYIRAARPETAIPLYERFVESVERAMGHRIETGVFGADMQVELVNDGPVTIWIDSKNRE